MDRKAKIVFPNSPRRNLCAGLLNLPLNAFVDLFMLKKISYSLIGLSLLVVFVAIWYLWGTEEIEIPKVADPTTTRSTTNGDFVGFIDSYGARAWLGIPFAEPPINELRWKAPVPPSKHSGLVEALEIGNACPQLASAIGPSETTNNPDGVVGSEDCLYLNIWSAPNSVKRPVMLWLHGGGNTIGHGGSYNGAKMAMSENVVVVTINYRLGFLGWFQHPAVLEGSELDKSGNFGTLDTVMALIWVQRNIEAFGGDPNNITIFGESAGGYNVLALIASPMAKNLFHKAIVQSGGFDPSTLENARNAADDGGHENSATELVEKILIKLGEASDKNSVRELLALWSDEKLALFLRNLNASSLFSVVDGGGFGMIDVPTIVQDGLVVPRIDREQRFAHAHNHNQVPIILGTNRDEPTLFMFQNPRYVKSTLGIFNTLVDEQDYLREVYYRANGWKASGVDEIAIQMQDSGNANVFAYRFDWDEEPSIFGFDLSIALGAAHGLEIAFVFGSFDSGLSFGQLYPNDENQRRLSREMMSYWAEFAYSGDPGTGRRDELPHWLSWQTNGKTSIIFDTPQDGGIRMDDQIMTMQKLKVQLVNDLDFNRNDTRCEIYATVFGEAKFFESDEYRDMGCEHIDPDSISYY